MTDIVDNVPTTEFQRGFRAGYDEAMQIRNALGPAPASEWRDISTAPVIAQRDDRETIARILVPHWLGGFENQERVDTPDASGWRSWKNTPFTPNARAYAIADEILAALSMPISAHPQRNEVKK